MQHRRAVLRLWSAATVPQYCGEFCGSESRSAIRVRGSVAVMYSDHLSCAQCLAEISEERCRRPAVLVTGPSSTTGIEISWPNITR